MDIINENKKILIIENEIDVSKDIINKINNELGIECILCRNFSDKKYIRKQQS